MMPTDTYRPPAVLLRRGRPLARRPQPWVVESCRVADAAYYILCGEPLMCHEIRCVSGVWMTDFTAHGQAPRASARTAASRATCRTAGAATAPGGDVIHAPPHVYFLSDYV